MVWKVPIFYGVYILRENLSVQFQLIQKVNSTKKLRTHFQIFIIYLDTCNFEESGHPSDHQ